MLYIINGLFIFSIVMLIVSISYFWDAAKEIRKGLNKDDKKIKSIDQKAYFTLFIFIVSTAISYILSLIFY
ncbi:hypothetical protein [Geotoga petraea]|uniref:Uncharacterized protein n=1 Tax=Geotoga petraea TaxID=28234 RepID=A0A1G6IQX2_9BACT|nr:hypothetical protein [Geotoga petraea]MDK2945707.1 hypothetical protein [Geotoga sp.]TGG89275.1 hypothetical protein E4650_03545 [Geotoga petraea]SDC08831.1 hypothetical protein SAMN04488588_0455 [Geotoga petraea]